ncbi:hypothetical protein GCM10023088_01100 [Actinomadura verrucosospora]|uniref:hypothetical protein n=1 Tax=Actinomadura TaxID=1988 RepID=UPI0031F01DFE
MTNENKADQARAAEETMNTAQDALRDAGKAYVQDPTPENKQAMDDARVTAEEATAHSRRLHGGSQ